jgi:hypothetical protein
VPYEFLDFETPETPIQGQTLIANSSERTAFARLPNVRQLPLASQLTSLVVNVGSAWKLSKAKRDLATRSNRHSSRGGRDASNMGGISSHVAYGEFRSDLASKPMAFEASAEPATRIHLS